MAQKHTLVWDARGLIATDQATGVVYDLTKGVNRKPLAKHIVSLLPKTMSIVQLLEKAGISKTYYLWFQVIEECGEDLIEAYQIAQIGKVLGLSDWEILSGAYVPQGQPVPQVKTATLATVEEPVASPPEEKPSATHEPCKTELSEGDVLERVRTKGELDVIELEVIPIEDTPTTEPEEQGQEPCSESEKEPESEIIVEDKALTAVLPIAEEEPLEPESLDEDTFTPASEEAIIEWDKSKTVATHKKRRFDLADKELRACIVDRIRFAKGFMTYGEVLAKAKLKNRQPSWLSSLTLLTQNELEAIARACKVSTVSLLTGEDISTLHTGESATSWLKRYRKEYPEGKMLASLADELQGKLSGLHPAIAHQLVELLAERLKS